RPSDTMVTQPAHGRRPIAQDRSPAVRGTVFGCRWPPRRGRAARGRRRAAGRHRGPVLRRSGRPVRRAARRRRDRTGLLPAGELLAEGRERLVGGEGAAAVALTAGVGGVAAARGLGTG